MRSPRFFLARLPAIAAAGAIAVSALIGPTLLPADLGGRAAQAAVDVDIGFFQQELSPYGRWFNDDRYGEVWQPAGVHRGWRPYYDDGHWVYSDDYGWMWVSDYDWGWAPFHYGRWAYSPQVGWFWVPGRQWGPAWVTFRSGPDLIGWAPLPPEAYWEPGYGFGGRDYFDDDDYDRWSFVRTEGFAERRFHRYAYDRRDYPRIIHRTKNVTNITIINNRIVNKSIEVNNIERVTRKKVRRVRVEEADRPTRARRKGEDVVIYKPAVVGDDEQQTIKKKKRAAERELNQVEPSAGVEQPSTLKKKKRRNTVEDSNQVQQFDQGEPEQPVLKKKKKRRNAVEDSNQVQQLDQGEPEQPVLKKKKKRRNAVEDSNQVQQFDQGEPEQPVLKKKKKRSNAAAGNQVPQFDRIEPSAGNDGTVRKKRQRIQQQQLQNQQPEQPRRKKKCKGDGCPDNN